jgi:hypothetical protein
LPNSGLFITNTESAWDASWIEHYGGEDDPTKRTNFIPAGFTPGLNPFYVALPYNDVDDHHTRPEAHLVIPWFKDRFVRDGQSVCKGHWVAIRHGKRICYAQWEDVGPFQVDHWQYVFGGEGPRPNPNHDSGLDVSPAESAITWAYPDRTFATGNLSMFMKFQMALGPCMVTTIRRPS